MGGGGSSASDRDTAKLKMLQCTHVSCPLSLLISRNFEDQQSQAV